jgi:phosphomannomutase
MDELIVSVSGLRGIVGTSLTAEVAVRYAEAFLATLPPGPVVIGRDGRASGRMFADAIAAAVVAAGRDVLDGDVAATPTVGILVQEYGAAGGIQISASLGGQHASGS